MCATCYKGISINTRTDVYDVRSMDGFADPAEGRMEWGVNESRVGENITAYMDDPNTGWNASGNDLTNWIHSGEDRF